MGYVFIDVIMVNIHSFPFVAISFPKERYWLNGFHEFNDVNISIHEFPLNNDFASFKNHLNSCCKHGDYIFQLDADEFPDSNLIYNLHAILEANPTVDVFRVPRINIVSGITEKFIKKWHWRVSHVDNRINFPDFQWRLYRNVSSICWKNKVHEVLAGFNTITDLPAEDEFCLVHIKSLPKQISQNAYYDTIH